MMLHTHNNNIKSKEYVLFPMIELIRTTTMEKDKMGEMHLEDKRFVRSLIWVLEVYTIQMIRMYFIYEKKIPEAHPECYCQSLGEKNTSTCFYITENIFYLVACCTPTLSTIRPVNKNSKVVIKIFSNYCR